jgi:diguanylate cyclase (GGDEF)-like protein
LRIRADSGKLAAPFWSSTDMDSVRQHDPAVERRAAAASRRKLLFGSDEELDRHLQAVRSGLIDGVIRGLLIFAAVGVPASLLRIVYTGWLPLYGLHLLLGAVAWGLFAARARLSDRFKAAAVMALFWIVGLAGLLSLGLAGAGMWWLVISSLLMSVLYSIRSGLVVMILAALVMSAVGVAFCTGVLAVPAHSSEFLRSPVAWAGAVLGATLMPLLMFQAVAALHGSTIDLLKQAAKQRELIRELATHDELTGVPGLTLAMDRLEQSLRAIPRSGRKVGLLFIDLDGFKAINDSLGHEAGDAVLTAAARRLRLNLRAEDTVARIGGDEFLAILSGIGSPDEAIAIAAKLQRLLAEPIEYGDGTVSVGSSIGAAFAAHAGYAAEDMIRAADAAMYQAKRAGGNQVRLATPAAAGLDAAPEGASRD